MAAPIRRLVPAYWGAGGRNTFVATAKSDPRDTITVEVGDSKQSGFYPQLKLMRWDNEVNFSARLVSDEPAAVSMKAGQISWDGAKVEAQFYDRPELEDGGFEFAVLLKGRPASNVLTFTFQSKGLEFLYQAPLDEEDPQFQRNTIVKRTPTECFDKDGKVVHSRPENVIGSYAVYHSTLSGNFLEPGGKDYKTGKAFHIYRPEVVDAKGAVAWCDLRIDHGLMTVTVPQTFLDSATYPVLVDPTYGYTANGASEDNSDDAILTQSAGIFGGTTNATLTGWHWRGRFTSSATKTVELGLYSDTSSLPVTRREMFSTSLALTTTITTFNTTVAGAYALTNGTTYWIATASNAGAGWRNEYDAGSGTGGYRYPITTLPTPFGTFDGTFNNRISFYFDYTNPVPRKRLSWLRSQAVNRASTY